MALQWVFLGDVAEHIMSYLETRSISRMETAGKIVDRDATTRCYEVLARLERRHLEWRPRLIQTLPEQAFDKDALKELCSLKRNFSNVPASWSPQIGLVSPSCLQVTKSDVRSEIVSPCVSPWAVIPLALGSFLGDEISVGIRIQSNVGRISEGIWFGLLLTGLDDGVGKSMSVYCSPSSGKCIIRTPGDRGIVEFISQAMPALEHDPCETVDIYAFVSASGDVEFTRLCPTTNSSASSGRISRDWFFPSWIRAIYAVTSIQIDHISFDNLVSTRFPGRSVLQGSQLSDDYDAVWSLNK